MESKISLSEFQSRKAMVIDIADRVEEQLIHAVERSGTGFIALSGGSTPKGLYENLACRDLPFSSLKLELVDERWVPTNHPRSNEKFLRDAFSDARNPRISSLYEHNMSIRDRVAQLNATSSDVPFDVVVLGLGEDGHTASWFPHAIGLDDALEGENRYCAIKAMKSAVTGDEVDRISLSLSAISDANLIVMMIAGLEKRRAFELAVKEGSKLEMPARAILRKRPDIWVCWAP